MKRIKVLGSVLKRTRADKIIIGFIVFIFAIAAVIQLVEPDINRAGTKRNRTDAGHCVKETGRAGK